MKRTPCAECESRTATCHTWCPAWLKYEAERNAVYAARDIQRDHDWEVISYTSAKINRMKRGCIGQP